MELEKKVQEHEKKLSDHDRELGRLDKRTLALQEQINDSLTRVDESNRFLREQNTRQSEQQTTILNAILHRNNVADSREHELNKMKTGNLAKIVLAILGSGGVGYLIIEAILNK